jgi:hypothetical protein
VVGNTNVEMAFQAATSGGDSYFALKIRKILIKLEHLSESYL